MEIRFSWAALACAVAVSGCHTADLDLMAKYADGVASGRTDVVCEDLVERTKEKSQSQLMWTLDAAVAKSFAGDIHASNALFDFAENILADNDQTGSAYRGANQSVSFFSGDFALDYDCGGTERMFCNIYKAQNYAALGNRAAANTELNRALVRQEGWLSHCRDRIAQEQAKIDADKAACATEQAKFSGNFASVWASAELGNNLYMVYGYNPMNGGHPTFLAERSFMNPYLCHLAGVLKRITMSTGGEVYLKDAARLLPRHPVVTNDFAEAEVGKWPRLTPQPSSGVAYSVAGGAFVPLLDVDASLSADFRVRLNGIVAREVAKRVAMVGSEIAAGMIRDGALGVAAYKQARGKKKATQTATIVAASSTLVNLGMKAWNAATQSVDVRCWSALPQRVLVTRVARPTDGRVEVRAGNEALTVSVEEGNAIIWIRKPSQTASAVVQTFSIRPVL